MKAIIQPDTLVFWGSAISLLLGMLF